MQLDYIRIPIYELYYIEQTTDFKGSRFLNVNYYKNYESETIVGIFQQLEWAVENPTYDFASLLPNLTFNNEEIYEFLLNIHSFMNDNKVEIGV
jgi:hypothetical protein